MYVFCFELLPKSDEHLLCRRRESKTDHHLRPPRLRRSSSSHHASSSGRHSLPAVVLPGAGLSSDERPPHRGWRFPPVRGFPPEENIQKDYHLRPPRLRRSSATHHASPSGQHSLPGGELPGATPPPASARLIGADAIRHPGQSGCHTKKSTVRLS